MGKKLAIKGHATRGKEVIELLEMLGGKNIHNLYGNNSFEYYVSGHAILNDRLSIIEDDDFVIFNLEEFLEKYPFKVGDKVHIYVQNDDIDGRYDIEATEIISMRWNPARCKITYKMKDINREFYKEEIKCKVDDSNKPTKVNMGKKLAIKGHATRGKEVIEILEMMSGYAAFVNTVSNNTDKAFFISDYENCFYRKSIRFIPDSSKELEEFNVFTLEEFLEKYPFKVGDKVKDCYGNPVTIKSMKWSEDFETMVYDFVETEDVLCAEDIGVANDMGLKIENGINMNIEFDLAKYSYEIKDGKLVVSEKTPKYPNNYEDCVRIAKNIHGYDIHIDVPAYRELLESFVKLLICRDAYWRIAGDEMGLGKPWEPDWNNISDKYTIYPVSGEIWLDKGQTINTVLAFPTIEIRDEFYDNFKDLIEECKELL